MGKIGLVVVGCLGFRFAAKSLRTRRDVRAAEMAKVAFENDVRRMTSGMYRVKTPADMGFC